MSRLNVVLAAVLVVLSAVVIVSTLSLRRALRASRAESAQLLASDEAHQLEIAELKKSLGAERAAHAAKASAMPQFGLGPMKFPAKPSPEAQARAARDARRRMTQMYGQGLAALHLPPEKLAALKHLLMEMNLGGTDLFEAAQAAGIQFDSPAFRTFAEKSRREIESEVTALIGTDDWSKLQAAAGASLYQQSVHNSIAYDFEDAGLPLNPGQEEALAQAMVDSEKPVSGTASHPPGYFAVDPSTGLKPADQAMLAEAADALSSAQLQLLKNNLVMQNRSAPDADAGGGSSETYTVISMETVETHVLPEEPAH